MGAPDVGSDEQLEDSPTAWFVVLEQALRASNLARAAEAQRELRRLGVTVDVRDLFRLRRARRLAGAGAERQR